MDIKRYIFAALSLIFINTAHAEIYFEAGFEFGGDDLASTTTGDSISAGGGIKLALGLQHPIGDGSSNIRIIGGYLFDSIDAVDGDADISTLTLDALYTVNSGAHSLGVGGTIHMGPEYTENSRFGSFSVDFDNALGFVLQYGFHPNNNLEVGVRYTNLTYEIESMEFDASGIGIFISNGF